MSVLRHPKKGTKQRTLLAALLAALSLFVVIEPTAANAPPPRVERSEALPTKLGRFEMVGFARQIEPRDRDGSPRDHLLSIIDADYGFNADSGFHVSIFKWENSSAAYADLTRRRQREGQSSGFVREPVGTLSERVNDGVIFFKGASSVSVSSRNEKYVSDTLELGRLIAATLPADDNDLPALVKHLPNWETTQPNAIYSVDADFLHQAIHNQPVLDAINFEGGTEAVSAEYGQARLLIVEFTTPQMSIDNDSQIWTKLAELKGKGEPAPTAYRRVGNYSVFVFNAPDEKTANALIDQVKYEQVVQWLGDDPHLYDRLQKYLTQTSANVLVAVLKSSGLSLILCLGIGGLVGALLFRHRRAQRAAAFSDAGGSIRLNLDELTGPPNTVRLLSTSEQSGDKQSS